MPDPTIRIADRNKPREFKAALNKLASDAAFREAVTQNPEKLTTDFHLSLTELHALRQAAILSGADMTHVNRVRLSAIGAHAAAAAPEWDVNVSCCCCCCCGETSVVRAFA